MGSIIKYLKSASTLMFGEFFGLLIIVNFDVI